MPNPLLARFDGEPTLVDTNALNRFSSLLNGAVAHEHFSMVQSSASASLSSDEFWTELGDYSRFLRPYVVKEGVLHLPIKGVLLNDFPYQFASYATGYPYIRAAINRAMSDPEVKGVAMIVDSGGGEVSGNFDLVDHIHSFRGTKPIAGFAMEHAYSAAYSLISAVDPGRITVARTGGVGSIGVLTTHVDRSQMLENLGLDVTYITAGKHKAEGNADEPLPKDVRDRIQARIDGIYDIFVATVARNRGMDEKAVRKTEALTFSAADAVSNGLADNIGVLDDAIAAFAADLLDMEENTMSIKEVAAADQAALETATATARSEGHAAGKAEGITEGATAERNRITAVISSDEGKARPSLALKMATGDKFAALDADTIVEMLAAMPEEAAATPAPAPADDPNAPKGATGAANDFTAAMNAAEHPELGAPAPKQQTAAAGRAGRALASIGVDYTNKAQ